MTSKNSPLAPLATGKPDIHTALALHQAGRGAEAEAMYLAILRVEPGHADALHLLGLQAMERNDNARAVELIRQALALQPSAAMLSNLGIALAALGDLSAALECQGNALLVQPDFAEAHSNSGSVLVRLGRLEAARTHFERARALRPNLASAHQQLAEVLERLGQTDAALAAWQDLAALKPSHAVARNNIGNILRAQGKAAEAAASYRDALLCKPDFAEAMLNLGAVLERQGEYREALRHCQQAVTLRPDLVAAHINLGVVRHALCQFDEAADCYRAALALQPDNTDAHTNLGNTLVALGNHALAQEHFRKTLELDPKHALAHLNLGHSLQSQGRLDMALDCYRKALALRPDNVSAYTNQGNVLHQQGMQQAALESYRAGLALRPLDATLHSNLLFALSSGDGAGSADYLAEARRFGAGVVARATPRQAWPQAEAAQGPLRVGLVTGDLNMHPVGYFLESLLAQIDPARVALLAYPTTRKEDGLTARVKPRFHAWHCLAGVNDADAAAQIGADGVQILIDLAGHTAHNRLPLFAWKPAPVQVSWLGYWASTGVEAIDHLLADPWCAPPELQADFSETLWRLPETRLCFSPPPDQGRGGQPLEPGPLPALRNGHLTFGCFQSLFKITDEVLALWAHILTAMPQARLRLQNYQIHSPGLRQLLEQRLARHGILRQAVLVPPVSRAAYLAAHQEVDMILDTFPYTGGTTTCEALWMGVPSLTLAGGTLLGRQGTALLRCAGLPAWVAESREDYLALALRHGHDWENLARLRATLRETVLASPLFDAARFARNLEQALQAMWQQKAPPPFQTLRIEQNQPASNI